jgi:hypothetical protein
MFNLLSISKIGECQRKAIRPASPASQVLLSYDNGLPSGRCPHRSWLLPRYRLLILPGAFALTRTWPQGLSLCALPSTTASCMSKSHPKPVRTPRTFTPSFTMPHPPLRYIDSPLFVAVMSLINGLKDISSLDDGNRYHLLLGKLHRWDESAVWFDGSSLGMKKPTWVRSRFRLTDSTAVFVLAIAVYLTVTIPALKAVVNPAEADPEFTLDQNLGLLGAGNTIIAGLLVLVLVMQARRTIIIERRTRLNFFTFRVGKSTRSAPKPGSWLPRRRKRPRRPSRSRSCWALFSRLFICLPLSFTTFSTPPCTLARLGSTATFVVFLERDTD